MALFNVEVINTNSIDVYPFVGKSSIEVANKFDSRVKDGTINGVVMLDRYSNGKWN